VPNQFHLLAGGNRYQAADRRGRDGRPESYLGFLTFDAHSNISGILEVNINGKVMTLQLTGATRTSATGRALGTIDFTTPTKIPLVLDFVKYFGALRRYMDVGDGQRAAHQRQQRGRRCSKLQGPARVGGICDELRVAGLVRI
jgi:hypothetical protein